MACPTRRSSHLLLAPTHNGLGNQYFGIEKGLWLAMALNRTLVLPPLLQHQGHGSFDYFPRCHATSHHTAAALKAYASLPMRWTRLFDFRGLSVVDFADVRPNYTNAFELACSKTRGWRGRKLRAAAGDAKAIITGSTLRMELDALRTELKGDTCGWRLLTAAHVLPFAEPLRSVAAELAKSLQPFVAVHLRSGDADNIDAETVVAAVAKRVFARRVGQRRTYVAYDRNVSFAHFRRFFFALCPDCPPCVGRHEAWAAVDADRRQFLVKEYGAHFAGIALDHEIAARADDLILSDGAVHTFRKKSSFGRLLQRRWLTYRHN